MDHDPKQDAAVSRALFSLATGLEVASGQQVLEAVGRAKQASVLFDEVVLESGLHIVEVGPKDLPTVRRRPAGLITREMLSNSRVVEVGTTTGIAIRPVEDGVEIYLGTNLPRLEDASYIEHDVAYRYVSEFHSGLLDDLAHLAPDWVRVVSIKMDDDGDPSIKNDELRVLEPGDGGEEPMTLRLSADEAAVLSKAISEVVEDVDRDAPPETGTSNVRDYILAQNLAEAVHAANELGAVPAVSSAFKEIAVQRGVPVGLPGAESLGFVVPNFSALPWEAIARFRDHPGAVEARGRLREFEAEAATRELVDSPEFIRTTGRAVTSGLMGAVDDLKPSLSDDLVGPVTGLAVGLVPIVGQYASLAVSMGDVISAVRQQEAFEGSWVAAVLELRDAAVDTLVDW